MRKEALNKRALAISKEWQKKYSPAFVLKYGETINAVAQAQADIEELTIDIEDEGKALISDNTGNSYINPKVNILSMREKRFDSGVKLLALLETEFDKIDPKGNAGRKPKAKSPEEKMLEDEDDD